MNLLEAELRLGIPELARGLFVTAPFLLLAFARGRRARGADLAMSLLLFASHFFFGVFSAFLVFWMQLLLWIFSREPRVRNDLRRSRSELVCGLASGLCFLVGLIFSGHLATLAWSGTVSTDGSLYRNLTLAAITAGVLVQVLRTNRETDTRALFGEAALTYAAFRILLVFFGDFVHFPTVWAILPIGTALAIGFFVWAEFRRDEMNPVRTWYSLSGSLLLYGLLLSDRGQFELFSVSWIFFASLEALARAEFAPSRVKRALLITLRIGLLLGVFGLSRPLFHKTYEAIGSQAWLQGLFFLHVFVVEFFGLLWIWREFLGNAAYSESTGWDWRAMVGIAVLISVNPLFLSGAFPISGEIPVEIPFSIFNEPAFRPQGPFGFDSLIWQSGLFALALVVSALWRRLRPAREAAAPHRFGVRRRAGTLFMVEALALRVSRWCLPIPPLAARPNFGADRLRTLGSERLRTQVGFALVFLIFLWFLLGKAV